MTSTDFDGTAKKNPLKLQVLIADDDKPTRVLLTTAVRQWGYEVVEASNGEEAWTIVQNSPAPQLLILDFLMPKLDGMEVCTHIRNTLAPNYNPYIILLTQTSGAENIIKGLDAGANEFLSKPPSMAELRSRICVGEKIIRYENELAEKNKKLQNYISQIETANSLVLSASQKLAEAMKATRSLESMQKTDENIQRLEELENKLEDVMAVFSEFNPQERRKS